ncbi:hypothetical protein [Taklimakanibacter lacteus]|uniref:hypothetical protein n=1 Tax=Taklimakanibacter lacteus TaxID=2268456 RepID=UPI000E66B0B4
MADNVSLPGAGSVIASDEVSGVQFQKVKLDLGGDGLSAPLVSGQATSASSVPVVGPSDDQIAVQVDITRPADTTAYAVNDALADSTSGPTAGGFTLASMAKVSGGSGIITDVIVTSSNDPATPLQCEVVFFNQAVTAINDNAAFAVSDAEIKTCLGKIGLALEDMGNNDFAHASGLAINYTCVGSADLRFLMRVKNAYVPASGEVVTVIVKAIRQ